RLDRSERFVGRDLIPRFGELYIDDVAQLLLSIIRDSNRPDGFIHPNPLMFFGIQKFLRVHERSRSRWVQTGRRLPLQGRSGCSGSFENSLKILPRIISGAGKRVTEPVAPAPVCREFQSLLSALPLRRKAEHTQARCSSSNTAHRSRW